MVANRNNKVACSMHAGGWNSDLTAKQSSIMIETTKQI